VFEVHQVIAAHFGFLGTLHLMVGVERTQERSLACTALPDEIYKFSGVDSEVDMGEYWTLFMADSHLF
jgi:hypothetical protein